MASIVRYNFGATRSMDRPIWILLRNFPIAKVFCTEFTFKLQQSKHFRLNKKRLIKIKIKNFEITTSMELLQRSHMDSFPETNSMFTANKRIIPIIINHKRFAQFINFLHVYLCKFNVMTKQVLNEAGPTAVT